MDECLVCKREFTRLKFVTDHIKICTRCVNTVNEFSAPAKNAYDRLGELLAKGMRRNAMRDLESDKEWIRRKARWTLDNFSIAQEQALPAWLNRLLADKKNSTRDFKMARAHRRHLLRLEGDRPWSYPSSWREVATGIRKRDGYMCVTCGAQDVVLDVHHIIYLSNFGTNRQHNLVTLCRPCHEEEHGRVFDFGEVDDPEATNPIRPKPAIRVEVFPVTMPEKPDLSPPTETQPVLLEMPLAHQDEFSAKAQALTPSMTVAPLSTASDVTSQQAERHRHASDEVPLKT